MSVETASIVSFATNGALAPAKLAVPFSTPTLTLPQALSTAAATTPNDRAQQAISAVKQANANWRGLRKSMAGFRLQYAQAALKALMFFGGGDPVQIAKRAAQLAREVRSAAQEYVAAGGDAGDVVAAQAAAQTVAADPSATAPSPTVATAATANGPGSFTDDARTTLSALRAIVARSRQSAKNDRQHHQAVANFKDAAGAAETAVGQAGSPAANVINLLI